jgi:hypothetical protein
MHDELLNLVNEERKLTTQILELLQLIHKDLLYLDWGYCNLFDYLVRGLGYSETTAYQRKSAIVLMQEIPEIKQDLEEGKLHFTSLAKATKSFKNKSISEKRQILEKIKNKSSREVEKILAIENPEQLAEPTMRYVNGDTVRLTIDLSESEYEELQKLRALKSHAVHNEKELITLLVSEALQKHENVHFKPSTSSDPRQIPKILKNALLKKTAYTCQFPGCKQTHFLQIDHIKPVRLGGNKEKQNLQVLCAYHNQWKG